MLGGSSGLNFLAWNRAASPEYDAWNYFAGGQDWTFNGLLPFFKKATTTQLGQANTFPGLSSNDRTADFNSNFVGTSGPIQVRFSTSCSDSSPTTRHRHPSTRFIVIPYSLWSQFLTPSVSGRTQILYVQTIRCILHTIDYFQDNGTNTGVVNSRRAVDVSRGVRSYATQYYCRSVSRSNFKVLTGAQVSSLRPVPIL